ncbi:MAG: glycoside hydrolase family 2 protein [Clostridia bacterium]|nr:glycoside hydrolase family 2 protein [Clostridia bacterium]
MLNKSLCGKWQLADTKGEYSLEATVPGCNYLDLMEAKIIKDPFYGENEKEVYWVAERDWIYRKSFTLTAKELEAEKIRLICKRLDTICTILVNGKKIGEADNCFIAHEFDVKEYLAVGENLLEIVFETPVNYVKERYEKEKTPPNSNGQNGIVRIRKPQCHFGWDWGPVLPVSGIGDDIYLEMRSEGKIEEMKIRQQKNEDGSFTVSVKLDGDFYEGEKAEITLTSPYGEEMKLKDFEGEFRVENPTLWWTYEMNGKKNQPLYTVKATLKKGRKVSHSLEKKIGLRTIELDRSPDEYGETFRFILNGVPLFIKGANFIPGDSLPTRYTKDNIEYLLDTALYSNMNMLRIWGGGYYESDEFYDLCDEKGILLWQDFMFACQPYPFFDEAFLANVKKEIEYNIKRLRHHASLALWCGNNEIEAMAMGWLNFPKYIKWTETFFYNILPEEVRKYDEDTPFIPGSPCGTGHMKETDGDNYGDTHLWAVWHGLQNMKYYRKRMTRFCSEFGFESLPDIKTIRTFAEKEDYDIHSPVFLAHQKCSSGNDKMLYYIASRFRLPEKFEDLIYLSQVTQLECISDATEHWRRNKGRCNGSIYWQFNDCWGVCSWASMDYYGNYKALQYRARQFFAPVSVSIEDKDGKVKLYILNDKPKKQSLTLKCKIFDFEKGILQEKSRDFEVDALENYECFTLYEKQLARHFDLSRIGVKAELYKNGKLINEKTYLFKPEKELKLTKPEMKLTAEAKDGEIAVTVKSDRFARLVRVESSLSMLPLSDNYFDLLPGESRTVTMKIDEKLDERQQLESFSLMCANDVVPVKSKLYDLAARVKLLVRPDSIGQFIYYGKKSLNK